MLKHYRTCAQVLNDEENETSYVVELKNNCRFVLNGCYFRIKKQMFEKYPDSDFFEIDFITNQNKKDAENTIKHAVDILIYITGIPYEIDDLWEDHDISIQSIDENFSKKKIELINSIDSQYKKISKKKELLENVLRLNAIAQKYALLLNDGEESYFAMFRIIEKIAKDEFEIEHNTICDGYSNIRSAVANVINNSYGIKIPDNKLDEIARKISAELIENVFSDIYSKIAWFCKKKQIEYNENILSKAVKIRNKIAHGENVDIKDSMEEYILLRKLERAFIYEKFFNGIKKSYLPVRAIW